MRQGRGGNFPCKNMLYISQFFFIKQLFVRRETIEDHSIWLSSSEPTAFHIRRGLLLCAGFRYAVCKLHRIILTFNASWSNALEGKTSLPNTKCIKSVRLDTNRRNLCCHVSQQSHLVSPFLHSKRTAVNISSSSVIYRCYS